MGSTNWCDRTDCGLHIRSYRVVRRIFQLHIVVHLKQVTLDVLDAAVSGSSLAEPLTLRGQLSPTRTTLLVFLRHFGCCFCREMVKDIRIASEAADGPGGERRYPKVVFVHMASPEQGGEFFGSYWPASPAISDPDKRLYDAFGLGRGSFGQMFKPAVWACGVRALRKGHGVGRPVGDPWEMPGLFLLEPDGSIVWSHDFRHAGDHPDFHAIASRTFGATV